jgi:shikimate dehydrogenase
MPLKEEALLVANSISDIANRISCGNTLWFSDGVWKLTSTDVSGFDHSLSAHGLKQIDSVLVIGAGATARAAVASVSRIAKEVSVISRNPERESAMNQASFGDVTYLPWQLTDRINSVDLVINTTPKFAAEFFLPSIDNPRGTFFEVLYNPWPTAVSKFWSDSHAPVIDGLDLLIHQAISQVEIFAGINVEREVFYQKMRVAALSKLA